MAATYFYQLEGWPNSPSVNNNAHRFNCDSGAWDAGSLAAPPFTGQAISTNTGRRQLGGWDGNYWYVIGPDGKLYRYNPATNTWSSALGSGLVVVPGTVEDQDWCMCSDGRFLYLYATGSSFRRYDPAADTFSNLASPITGADGPRMFMCYDGTDTIYFYRGDTGGQWGKYTISTNVWSSSMPTGGGVGFSLPLYAAFLQGKLWVLRVQTQNGSSQAFSYNPGTNTWSNLATIFPANGFDNCSPFHEMTDSSIRIWSKDIPGVGTYTALDYNVLTNTWANGPNASWVTNQGGNFAVARTFNPLFTWYLSDGVTLANATERIGAMLVGDTVLYHLIVKTPVARSLGATVSVPALVTTDADDVVLVSSSSNGPWATSFSTGALTAGQAFDVWVQVKPTAAQTLGLNKTFNLKVVAN